MTPEQIIKNFIEKQPVFEVAAISEFGFIEKQIIQMMKEYATLCCEAQKNIFLDMIRYSDDYDGKAIDYETILNTPITLL